MYDLSKVESNSGNFEILPTGEYEVICIDAELKMTKDLTGEYIACKFEVIGHTKYAGRYIWQNFNMKNKSEEAARIGQSQLKQFLIASRFPTPNTLKSVDQLLQLTAHVKTKVKQSAEFGDKAVIAYFIEPKVATPMKTGYTSSKVNHDIGF